MTLCRHHRGNDKTKQAVQLFAEYFGNLSAYCDRCRESREILTTPWIQESLFMGDNPRKNNSSKNPQKTKREQTQDKKRKAFDMPVRIQPKPGGNKPK